MTLEEKVVAYLDGSLGEEESAELLHRLSASPDKRAVLEEHLRLTNLVSLGRKPFAVPAAAERALVDRLPFLADTPKPIPFYAKPMALLASSAAVLAVIGGLWWNANRAEAPANNTVVSNSAAPVVQNEIKDNKDFKDTKDIRVSQPVVHVAKREHAVMHVSIASAPVAPLAKGEASAAQPQANTSDDATPSINVAALKAAAIPTPSGYTPHTLHEIVFGAPQKVHPFSIGFSSMASGYYFPSLDASVNSALGMDPQITADYDITPWFEIGLEAGYTEFGKVTNNYVLSPAYDGTEYTQLSYITEVAPMHTGYLRASMHFTADPMSEFPIRFGAAGGYAFEGTGAPCAALSAGVVRTVSDNLTVDLDFVLSGLWSTITDRSAPDSTGLTGIAHNNTGSQAPFTSAFGLRAGIRYRP